MRGWPPPENRTVSPPATRPPSARSSRAPRPRWRRRARGSNSVIDTDSHPVRSRENGVAPGSSGGWPPSAWQRVAPRVDVDGLRDAFKHQPGDGFPRAGIRTVPGRLPRVRRDARRRQALRRPVRQRRCGPRHRDDRPRPAHRRPARAARDGCARRRTPGTSATSRCAGRCAARSLSGLARPSSRSGPTTTTSGGSSTKRARRARTRPSPGDGRWSCGNSAQRMAHLTGRACPASGRVKASPAGNRRPGAGRGRRMRRSG